MIANFLQGLFFGFGFFLALALIVAPIVWAIFYFDKLQSKKDFTAAFLRASDDFIRQLEEQEQYLELRAFKRILEGVKSGTIQYDFLTQHYEVVSISKYIMDEEDESIREVFVEYIKKK
jgi:hypothetical protein